MSDNQRNTTTNESDSDTAGAAGVSDVETAERDTVEEEASETGKTEKGDSGSTEAAEAEEAEKATEAEKAEEATEVEESTEAAKAEEKPETSPEVSQASSGAPDTVPEPAESSEKDPVAEDRAEAGGTPVTEAKASSAPEGSSAVKATLSSRKAHLTVSRVEPWSVMKFSFVVSLVCFIILFVAVAVIYATLSMLGVFDELTNMLGALLEGDDAGQGELGLDPASWFSPGRVLGYTGVVGALNIVLITALSTVGAMLYNLVADLVGGVDVTLSEAE